MSMYQIATGLVAWLVILAPCSSKGPGGGEYALVTEYGERLISAEALPAYQLYNQAVGAAREGRHDDARSLYQRTLAIKPDLVEALINLSTLLGDVGDVAAVRACLEAALQAAEHPSLRATVLSTLGHLEQKVKHRWFPPLGCRGQTG